MVEINNFFSKKCWQISWLKIVKIFFDLASMLGRTASIQRGTGAQIARNSLSADYMLQLRFLFAAESSLKWS